MPRQSTVLYPSSARTLVALGMRLKDARLRRHFSAETVAARAGIARQTLTKIESENASVTMGNYFQVMAVLGLDKDINAVASDDVLGRRLQDAALPQRQRAPKRTAEQMKENNKWGSPVGRYLPFTNVRRPHSPLDAMTPDEYCYQHLPTLQQAA